MGIVGSADNWTLFGLLSEIPSFLPCFPLCALAYTVTTAATPLLSYAFKLDSLIQAAGGADI